MNFLPIQSPENVEIRCVPCNLIVKLCIFQNLQGFLAQKNVITTLNLAGTECVVEPVSVYATTVVSVATERVQF